MIDNVANSNRDFFDLIRVSSYLCVRYEYVQRKRWVCGGPDHLPLKYTGAPQYEAITE